jgi:chromosome segregation ATPase
MTRKAKCDLEIAEKILFQSEIAQLKTELSAYKSQTEELKNDNAAMRFEASSKTSELDRLKEENHLVMANSNSFEERLVEKLCEIDQLTSYMIELENEISLLKFNDSEAKLKNEELKLENDELKKDVAYSRKAVAELQTKYQQLRDTRKSAMLSPEKSHQLAEGQVAALSEALTALQDAMTPTKEATADSDIGSAKREKIKKTMFTQMALGLESLIKHGSLTKKVIL